MSCAECSAQDTMGSQTESYSPERSRGPATRILLVRHYRTLSNAHQLIMGWGDAPPAANWEEDLLQVARTLRRRQIAFDAIYSSALGRAQQTACYYADRWGLALTHPDQGLNEINYGCLRGKCKDWAMSHFPEYKTDLDFVYPEGESFREMQRRSAAAFLAIAERHPGETLLIVAHAGVIRGLVCHCLGLDFSVHLKARVSHRYIGDFLIREGRCAHYDELGNPSGFVREGAIHLPWRQDDPPIASGNRGADPSSSVPTAESGAGPTAELLQPA